MKNPSRLSRVALTVAGVTAACLGAVLPLGASVAAAAPAQGPQWSYIAQYPSRGACESAIAAYQGRPDTSSYRCISNGNPGSSAEPTYALYNLVYP